VVSVDRDQLAVAQRAGAGDGGHDGGDAVLAFWMSQNLNDYVGSGSVSSPREPHQIEYAQAIFSKRFIPVPAD
jgi:hypothetical protein